MTPWVGLSLMLEDDFREASGPLFAEGLVDALEWSFDTGWDRAVPAWAEGLFEHYGDEGRLFGHGVHYSPLSAAWEERQARWLTRLGDEVRRRRYAHVSEHYGFMTAGPFQRGAPIPPPRARATRDVGRDRLARMRDRAASAVGLENLALAFSAEEALAHGAFLEEILGDDGFVLLDLHNLHCQSHNFDIDAEALLRTYPLDRVHEVHVSGGSFLPAWPDGDAIVRCDTHDGAVPDEVFRLLEAALEACPNVRVVVLERLGGTMARPAEQQRFRDDFRRVRALVAATSPRPRPPLERAPALPVASDMTEATLAQVEAALLSLLTEATTEADVHARLDGDPTLADVRDALGRVDGRAIGIASRVVKKWARRVAAPSLR